MDPTHWATTVAVHDDTNVSGLPTLEEDWVESMYYSQLVYIPPIVLGCLLTLYVFIQSETLKTPDNYCIAALAFADLLIGAIYIPITVGSGVKRALFSSSYFACILNEPLRIFLHFVSSSMHTLLTIDRFLAVRHPFWYNANMTNGNIVTYAISLIAVDFVLCVIYGHLLFTNAAEKHNDPLHCSITVIPKWFLLVGTLENFIKILVMCVCTAFVVQTAYKMVIRTTAHENSQKDAKVTFAFMFLFLILVPHGFIIPVAAQWKDASARRLYAGVTYHLFELSSCFNVIIYAMSRKQYKLAFKFILTNRPCKWNKIGNELREQARANVITVVQQSQLSAVVSVDSSLKNTIDSHRTIDELKFNEVRQSEVSQSEQNEIDQGSENKKKKSFFQSMNPLYGSTSEEEISSSRRATVHQKKKKSFFQSVNPFYSSTSGEEITNDTEDDSQESTPVASISGDDLNRGTEIDGYRE